MITTREWVSIGIIVVALAAGIIWPATRQKILNGLPGLLRAFFQWKLLVILGAALTWVVVCISLGYALGWWNWSLLKDTILLVVTLVIPALFRVTDQESGSDIGKRLLQDTIGIAALVTFYVNLASFPLWAEIPFQVVVLFLLLVQVAAARLPDKRLQGCAGSIVAVLGLVALIWTTVTLVEAAGQLGFVEVAQSFLLTLWVPALLFPFLYAAGFAMAAELALVRMGTNNGTATWHPASGRTAFAIVLGLHFSVRLANGLVGRYGSVGRASSLREVMAEMKAFRADVRKRDKRERERRFALRRNVGAQGVDAEGARLDRREFAQTKRALDWIATIEQTDHNRGGNYWDDRADELLAINGYGLRPPFAVVVNTTADRQKWRAWRRTISGWVLGRAGQAEDTWREWYFAGPEPPTGWPGDPEWTERLEESDGIAAPPDWANSDATDDV